MQAAAPAKGQFVAGPECPAIGMGVSMTFADSLAGRRGLWLVCLFYGAAGLVAQDGRSPGWIVIPASEYHALRSKALPPAPAPSAPEVEATLSRVDYTLQVAGGLATGQATLTVDVMSNRWVRVPIPEGILPRDARVEGKLVSLVRGPGGMAVLLPNRGRSIVKIELAVPVVSTGEERLSLPSAGSAVTRVNLTLPSTELDVRVSGGLVWEKLEGEGQEQFVLFAGGSGPLSIAWHRRKAEIKTTPLPLRLRASLVQTLALGEENAQIGAEASLDIVQGTAQSARLLVPAGITVNAVSGGNVADWQVRDGTLLISFLEPVEHRTAFTVSAEARLAREGSIDLPLFHLEGAERDSGGVAVEVLGAGEIRNLRSRGLERVEPADLGATVASRQSPSLLAFRYRPGTGERGLAVDVVRYSQQAVLTANAEEARYRVLVAPDGKTLVEARYAVRNNQRNFVRIALPTGAALWSASLAGRPAHPGTAPDGSLLFPLAKSRAGEEAPVFAIELVYLTPGSAWTGKGRALTPLPALDLPVSRTGVLLYYPPDFTVTAEPGTFRVQEFVPPSSPALAGASAAADDTPSALPPSAAQQLIDGYRKRRETLRPAQRAATLAIEFPAFGPSIYLAGELTPENQAPAIPLDYRTSNRR